MSAPFIIPFNYQPASSSVKTSSYTIPSGKYAYVKTSSPFLFIDGIQMYPTVTWSFNYVASSNVFTTSSLPVGSSYIFSGSMTRAALGSGTLTMAVGCGYGSSMFQVFTSTSLAAGGTVSLPPVFIPSGDLTCYGGSSSLTVGGSGVFNAYVFSELGKEFWLPPGTVINGNAFHVTEYNVIS